MEYRALKQPRPMLNSMGDCAPCCIAGVSRKPLLEIYDIVGGVKNGITYMDVIRILNELHIPYENYLPSESMWSNNPEYFTFGRPSWYNFQEWWKLSNQRINNGLIGLANVNFNGKANIEDYTDHFVIIYGLDKKSEAAVDKLVLISCPAKGEYRIPVKEFLWKHGGYNTIWVKPLF